jgi:Ca2+-binding EF-hand superfamily protein
LKPGGDGNDGGDVASKLLERIGSQSTSAAPLSVDLATFVNLMTSKAVAEYTRPERELLPAFEAIDLDGDGLVSREEMVATIERFCTSLPDADGCDIDEREELPSAIAAFANEEELLDYERFVEMVSGRSGADSCEIEDLEEEGDYQSIFGAI